MSNGKQRESPRLSGMYEHLERVRLYFSIAQKEADAVSKFRFMIAGIYSCRAITELILEAAEKQELSEFKDNDPKRSRDALEIQIAHKIPFYYLIERIRIHDFHRFGIVPPDPNFRTVFFGGPMTLTAQKGAAGVSLTEQGPVVSTTGGSRVKLQRPLLVQDGQFFEEEQQRFVALEELLSAFLEKAPDVISEFWSAQG